jgi:hypothetical protein
MNAPTINPSAPSRSRTPGLQPALEILVSMASIAAATLAFIMGWLSCNQAAVLTLGLLLSLTGLAWIRFDGGRHPCFLFLCTLTLFQAGRVMAYCAGGVTDMFQVTLMTSYPFSVPGNAVALVLVSLALSAVCIYAPCRWHYRAFAPPGKGSCGRFLPYLYLLFCWSVPVQLYKNFCYYQYARDHGGYLALFLDRGGLVSSVPLAVRAVSMVSLPAFAGVFVLEGRKRLLSIATAVYFTISAPILLLGSRGALFGLVVSLWYVAKVKSGQPARLHTAGFLAVALVVVGSLVGSVRDENGSSEALTGPTQFLTNQGVSLDVTEIAFAYRSSFAPHIGSYLSGELQEAFFPADRMAYVAGRNFDADVSMFLSPAAYALGCGTGSSYLAEAYLAGGLAGVLIVSLLLGFLFHGMHRAVRHPFGLYLVALLLPDVLWMPRGDLLAWVSAALRMGISMLLLLTGWYLYQAIARIGGAVLPGRLPGGWRGYDAPGQPLPKSRFPTLGVE